MPTYEVKYKGKSYDVEASNLDTASKAVSKMFSSTDSVGGRTKTISSNIEERGAFDPIGKMREGGFVNKLVGGLQLAGSPVTLAESALSNPILAMQRGQFNPLELAKEAKLGITGQKQGQLGDIGYQAGLSQPVASGIGLAATMVAPMKLASTLGQLRGVAKFTDKGIRVAGESLVKGADSAIKHVGENLTKAYQSVNDIAVDGNKFLDAITKAPKALIQTITDELREKLGASFTSLEDYMQNLNIAKVREIKSLLGKYRPNIFGKEERGLAENIDAEKINKAYASVKKLMDDTIKNASGEKQAKALSAADTAFSKAQRAADVIRKETVDATLREPTKAGNVAKGLKVEGNITTRVAIDRLKRSGKEANKNIQTAINKLQFYNALEAFRQTTGKVLRYGLYGGAAGTVGSQAIKKSLSNSGN